MPTSKEVLSSLDHLRQLIHGPLPGARERRVMFLEIYKVLRKILPPEHQPYDLGAKPEPAKPKTGPASKDADDDGDDLDLPFLDRG
jgi:hypothetical protein